MAINRRAKFILLALAGLSLAALALLWSYRAPITRDLLDAYLAARGVDASYEIKAIEARRQRLEHVRLGPAHAPDLVADWVEIDVGPSLTGLSVKAVRAGGVRLRAKVTPEKIFFGTLDRLFPPPSDAAFELPDIDLSLEDARARIESPWGQMGLRLDGQGNLRGGFEGKLAAVAPQLDYGGCRGGSAQLYGDVSVVGARPSFVGPLRLARFDCGTARGAGAEVQIDANIAEDGQNWRGTAQMQLARLSVPDAALRGTSVEVRFQGNRQESEARFLADVNAAQWRGVRAVQSQIQGRVQLGSKGMALTGSLRSQRVLPGAALAPFVQMVATASGAPLVGPLARQMAQASNKLGAGITGRVQFRFESRDAKQRLALGEAVLTSASGARFSLPRREALVVEDGRVQLYGSVRFGGGGLPAGRGVFSGATGRIEMAPYLVRGARLRLTPIDLAFLPQGVEVVTRALIDGPIGAGRMRGVSFPIRFTSGQGLAMGCVPIGFEAARFQEVRVGRTRMTACIAGEQLRLVQPRAMGRSGTFLLRFGAQDARYNLASGRFGLTRGFWHISDPAGPTELSLSQIQGRAVAGHVAGRITGLSGRWAAVPLRLEAAGGTFSSIRGGWRFQGRAGVADASPDLRFWPLRAENVRLSLRNAEVRGSASLYPSGGPAVLSRVSLTHNLATGMGEALLPISALEFGPLLQPEAITPVTLGVVANVRGLISGEGRINWSPAGVTSSGQFRTSGLDFAGAFGPVTGFAGAIEFTDLLALVTPPGQVLKIESINPGVLVTDGEVRFRLLPDDRVAVEGGRWPFAGGFLQLEPTILDLSETAERRLTFRVEGLDAARFITTMGFENISATGTYDGVLPMIFDASGGRIEGGRLEARGGGTVSYVGQVSNEDLGAMGRFAFDALKSIRYNRLAIDLNGAIDGDVITRVSFAGVNQAPVSGGRAKLPIKLVGASNLPFVFNVKISAKFRALFDMARSLGDPSGRIRDWFSANQPQKPVQPAESQPPR